jgi:hypothetical protein
MLKYRATTDYRLLITGGKDDELSFLNICIGLLQINQRKAIKSYVVDNGKGTIVIRFRKKIARHVCRSLRESLRVAALELQE